MTTGIPYERNTTYVAGVSEVKSADLNDLQDKIMDLHMQHQIHWAPIGQSFVGASAGDSVSELFQADTDLNTEVYTNQAGIIANTPFPTVDLRIKAAAGPTEQAVIYPKDGGAGAAWFDDLDDLTITMQYLHAVALVTGGHDVSVGLSPGATFGANHPGDSAGVHIMQGASHANDNLWVGATRAVDVDSGNLPVNDTWQLLKLIYYGKNTPEGVTAGNIPIAKYYVGGVEVASETAGLPSGGTKLTPYIFHRDNAAAADQDLYIGPAWISWTSLLLAF